VTAMDERIKRLMQRFAPGERVRAVETILYGTGEEVPEGTIGHVQQINVNGCAPLVMVAWIDPADPRDRSLLRVMQPCSVESLEPVQ